MRAALSLCLILLLTSPGLGEDWLHWRGANRNDITSESSGWNGTTWLPEKPKWQTRVGAGSTSPLVIEGKIYVLGWHAGKDTLSCLDAKSGQPVWTQSYPCPQYGRHSEGDKGIYSGCSSTPEYDPETGWLYSLSCDGDLIAWDTQQQGRQVWKLNLYDRYGVGQRPDVAVRRETRRDYGYTSSPLVHGSWLLVEVGDDSGCLMAFDKRTGAEVWKSEHRDFAGHSGGPVPLTVEGISCVALLTIRDLVVIRLDEGQAGKTVAKHVWTTDFANNIPTPAVQGNNVIVTSAYNRFAICRLEITLAGARPVWESQVCSGVCSPIIHRGHVYWAWSGVHCLDWDTGEEKWSGGRVGTAGSCIVTGDDRLIVWADNGDLTLVETASRAGGKYLELARSRRWFQTDVWPHITLSGGCLYCKDRLGNLLCLELTR